MLAVAATAVSENEHGPETNTSVQRFFVNRGQDGTRALREGGREEQQEGSKAGSLAPPGGRERLRGEVWEESYCPIQFRWKPEIRTHSADRW